MDTQGVRQLIRFIITNCKTTLTPKQINKMDEINRMPLCDIAHFRTLCRIAIDNRVYPECPYCKKPITSQDELTIDHIVPRAKGGTDNIQNLQPMHNACNCEKGSQMPEQKTCPEIPVKKHRKPHNEPKHHEREIVKGRTPEELYAKCKKADQARLCKCRATSRNYGK